MNENVKVEIPLSMLHNWSQSPWIYDCNGHSQCRLCGMDKRSGHTTFCPHVWAKQELVKFGVKLE